MSLLDDLFDDVPDYDEDEPDSDVFLSAEEYVEEEVDRWLADAAPGLRKRPHVEDSDWWPAD